MTNQKINPDGSVFEAGNVPADFTRVEIYHKTWCSFSQSALALLDEKGIAYTDLDVTDDRQLEEEMIERSGRTSVPEINPLGSIRYSNIRAQMYYTWAAVSGTWDQSPIAADSILFIGMFIYATPAFIMLGIVKIPWCPIASGGSGKWQRSES